MNLVSGIDRLLDLSVVPGYTRVGFGVRRRWWPDDPAPSALAGRSVAVTGANSGLGKATALGAARLGAEVHLLCRSVERGERARQEIEAAVAGAVVEVHAFDLSDLAGVRQAGERLARSVPRLHALVHNAGVMPPVRTETPEGHEVGFAAHVLGPHLLTDLLRPALAADGDARVVFVSSGGMYAEPLRVDDPEYTGGTYSPTTAYARTKRMQVHLAEEWARALRPEGIAVHSMHPGWADTPGIADSLPGFSRLAAPLLRTAEQGADTTVWLLSAPEGHRQTGRFWHDRRARPTAYAGRHRPTPDQVTALWRLCTETTGHPA